jgi:hypothetical protein
VQAHLLRSSQKTPSASAKADGVDWRLEKKIIMAVVKVVKYGG